MQKFEAFTGSAVWVALSLLMLATALEPVEVSAAPIHREKHAFGPCGVDQAELAMGCETIHL
jgi:hypothetical protein